MAHGESKLNMGEMEMIYPDGSGIIFHPSGKITMATFTNCDDCGKEHNIREMRSIMVGRNLDVMWICSECNRVK